MSLNYTWLPAALPDSPEALQIVSARGSYLYTAEGKELYDGIASWWCKPLGHCHPAISEAIKRQLNVVEHHIPAEAYNQTIEQLSTRLVNIFTTMDKVIYASDGSSAVEVAMKLSHESHLLQKKLQKNKYLALTNGYHGETVFTLGVCGLKHYTQNYRGLFAENYFIEDIVYVDSREDPLWEDAPLDEAKLRHFLDLHHSEISAFIFEPIVQGAGGLKIISKNYLQKLIPVIQSYEIHIITDEIMVGLGRLGYQSVTQELLQIEADMVCFAKNLTAGTIPMSCVVVNQKISNIYRQNNKNFPHSHTHSCNTLAAAAALAYLDYTEREQLLVQVKNCEKDLINFAIRTKNQFSFILKARTIGAIIAWETDLPPTINKQIYPLALTLGLYLRPIGNVIYLLPPLYNLQQDLAILFPKIEQLFTAIANISA